MHMRLSGVFYTLRPRCILASPDATLGGIKGEAVGQCADCVLILRNKFCNVCDIGRFERVDGRVKYFRPQPGNINPAITALRGLPHIKDSEDPLISLSI